MVISWLRRRIRGDKVRFGDLDVDKRYVIVGAPVVMLAGLAIALASHLP